MRWEYLRVKPGSSISRSIWFINKPVNIIKTCRWIPVPADKERLAWVLSFSVVCEAGLFLLGMMLKGKKAGLSKPEVLESAYLLVLIPFLSPLAWYYNYLYSMLAVVFLVNLIDRFPPSLKYILIADFLFIGASLSEILRRKVYYFYTQHALVVIGYLIILFYLVYSRFKLESA